jgi:RNA polymerase sigma-70 factor (ECF subfamily)
MELSDSQLAVMAGQGDSDAYRRLFERYQHPIYNFVYRMVDNAEDASDIVQDAFIKVHNVLAEKEVQNFSAYLYRTAKNLAYDEMRRRSRFVDVDHEVLAPEDPNIYADPQRAVLLGEQMEKVRQATNGLNEKQRAALILRELEGLDYDEMSEVMESNRNAVGALLSRARLKFREELRMVHVSTDQVPQECEGIIALLSPYIDGELVAGDVEEVETHLEQCTFCSAALEEMQEASKSFRALIPVIPPADMAEAFTRRMEDAVRSGNEQDPSSGEEGGPGEGTGESSEMAGPRPRSLAARLATSRFTLIAAALVAALTFSGFLLADEVGRDSNIAEFILGDEEAVERVVEEIDFIRIDGIRPAHVIGIVLDEEEQSEDEEVTDEPEQPEDPEQPGPEETAGEILSGSASPDPVDEYAPLTITVNIRGQASAVSVTVGDAMTVPLTLQSSGAKQVWSWTGTAPSYGFYSMNATAQFSAGPDTISIGTLEVLYVLY